MKQNRKALLSRTLASVLCFGMLGTSVDLSALAAGGNEAVIRAVSAGDAVKIGDTGYETLAEAVNAASEEETLVILKNMDVTEPVVITKKLTLTAAEPTVISKAADSTALESGCMFHVKDGGVLTLSGELKLSGSDKGATMVYADGGALIMRDNVIIENNTVTNSTTTPEGGAVTVKGNASFTMEGGSIENCGNTGSKSESSLVNYGAGLGGAVLVYADSQDGEASFIMNGGSITGCFAQYGGAVGAYTRNAGRAAVNMNGGELSANCAGTAWVQEPVAGLGEGAAILVCAYTDNDSIQVNVNGGLIEKNVAAKKSLGMVSRATEIKLGGHYNLLGGTVRANVIGTSADKSAANAWGCGVFANQEGLITLGGGAVVEDEIYLADCTATVRTDFVGKANFYKKGAAQDDTVALVVDENGEPANALESVRGELFLVDRSAYGTQAEDPVFRIIPFGNSFRLNAVNMAVRELLRVIDQVEAMNADDYTTASWKNLMAALTKAKEVAGNSESTQAEADAALKELLEACENLEYVANKAALEAAIQSAAAFLEDKDNYNYDSREIEKALEAARAVMADRDATQEEVNEAANTLLNRMQEVAEWADVTSLRVLIASAKEMLGGNYTEETRTKLAEAVAKAEAVLNDADRADDALGKEYAALIDAILGLQRTGNKAALEYVCALAEDILSNIGQYAPSTVAGLQAAADAAKAVRDNGKASQQEIDEQARSLTLEIAKARLLGDVNGDGEITTTDSRMILQASAEFDALGGVGAECADVNGDGAADTTDAALILKFAAEKITQF